MLIKATVTDVSNNKIRVAIKEYDNVVSDWINILPEKCTIKIGDITHSDCEYTPQYNINDKVVVDLKDSLKGLYVIGRWVD